jgi:hypothetical protein
MSFLAFLSRPLGRIVAVTVLLAALLLVAASAPRADAKGFDIGFADYLYNEEGEKGDREFRLTQSVNADVIRVNMYWSLVAPQEPANPRDPADPAYKWEQYDRAIARADEYGFDVDLTVLAAPAWAEGPNRPADVNAGAWKPDPEAFGDFAHALATRYSGSYDPATAGDAGSGGTGGGVSLPPILPRAGALPAVEYFEAWNEPNLSTYIMPQWDGKQNMASEIYVKLLNAFYDSVKGVNPGAKVVVGGTAPYGDPPGGPNRTQPIRFYQELLCLNTKNKKASCPAGMAPKFDIIAHHPINREDAPTEKADNKGDVEIADFKSLVKVLRKAEKQKTPATGGKHEVWANEVWWQTDPPDKAEGVSYKTHARWTSQGLYLLWKQGASNVTFLQFRDAKYTPGEFTLASYQTGVYTFNGKRKPTADAVAFPFVTDPQGKKLLAWGRAPKSGKLTIEAKAKGGYKKVKSFNVKAGKIFKKKIKAGDGKQVLRAKVGGETSVPWTQR